MKGFTAVKGLLAWNVAAVVGCVAVWLLAPVYGAGSMLLAVVSAALVYAVLMAMDQVPAAVLVLRDGIGSALIRVSRRLFTLGLRLRVLAQPESEGGTSGSAVAEPKKRRVSLWVN